MEKMLRLLVKLNPKDQEINSICGNMDSGIFNARSGLESALITFICEDTISAGYRAPNVEYVSLVSVLSGINKGIINFTNAAVLIKYLYLA